MRNTIKEYFKRISMVINLTYIDLSYIIRSQPVNSYDSAFCQMSGHNAVYTGLACRTVTAAGFWSHQFTHVPPLPAASRRKKIDHTDRINAVAAGQVLQGLNKPVNDLSCGCTVTDIVNTVAITAIQSQSGRNTA